MTSYLGALSKVKGGAGRLAEVVGVLAKYGLAEWLRDSGDSWLARHLRGASGEPLNQHSPETRFRLALTELGTTGIKLGQMLSTRADLLGQDLTDELAKLQADTPPDPFDTVRALVEAELGEPPEQRFARFEATPIASASIGQVHRATLQTGEQVVVKVMHEGIEEQVRRDLDILALLADLMERGSAQLRRIQPVATAKHFKRTLLREMDFGYEGRSMEEFGRRFEGDPHVRFATYFPQHSTRRVLTMEFLDGVPVSDRAALEATGEDLTEFARRGANAYLDMIFRDGFYHADPHPGNILLLEGNVVGILDCGMVGRLDEVMREEIESLLLAAIEPDPDELVEIVCRLGSVPPELDRDALRAELSEIVAEYSGQRVDQFDVGGALNRVVGLVRSYHIVLPQGFVLLLKTLVMLEGTGRQMSAGFSLAELLAPFGRRAMRRRLDPRRAWAGITHSYRDWRRLFESLPRDLRDILSRVRSESIEVQLEHRRLETTVDRLVVGILASALFVGSALILSSAVRPTVGGVSVLGAVGVLVSTALAGRLLIAIRRSRDRRG